MFIKDYSNTISITIDDFKTSVLMLDFVTKDLKDKKISFRIFSYNSYKESLKDIKNITYFNLISDMKSAIKKEYINVFFRCNLFDIKDIIRKNDLTNIFISCSSTMSIYSSYYAFEVANNINNILKIRTIKDRSLSYDKEFKMSVIKEIRKNKLKKMKLN